MKTALFSLIVFAAGIPATAAARGEPATISVNGSAEIQVDPDRVILTLGIETRDPEIGPAKAENDRRMRALIAAMEAQGIEAKHVQTDHIQVHPQYDDYQKRELIQYWVRKNVTVTLTDVSRFDAVLTAAIEAGANAVHGVEFRTTDLREHRDRARMLAIRAAKEKAVALAAEVDMEVGDARTIDETRSGWFSPYGRGWGDRGAVQNVYVEAGGRRDLDVDSTVAPGQISVTATVHAVFEIR